MEYPRKTFFWAASALMSALLLAAAGTSAQVLDILPNPTVSGPEMLLRELVRNSASLPDGWGNRRVMQAPSPGRSAEYAITTLASALQQYQDMQEVVLRGAMQVRVKRTGGVPVPPGVLSAIETFASKRDGWRDSALRIQCEGLEEDLPFDLSSATVRAVACQPLEASDRHRFHLLATTTNRIEHAFSVNATVVPLVEVWVATRPLERGTAIASNALARRQLPRREADNSIRTAEPIEGMELARAVREEQPIPRDATLRPLCVRNGDPLTVVLRRGSMEIAMRAKALASGRTGETILCLNERSKRRLRCTLTGQNEATLEY
jgi:flagella basal body P-ring formation protein FlgA